MVDLSSVPTEELKARLNRTRDSSTDLSAIPTEDLKARAGKGGAVNELSQTAESTLTEFQQKVQKKDPTVDYLGSAPFATRVVLEHADNPKEIDLMLSRRYAKGDYGQDEGGRWWVREGGKKVAVDPSGISGAFSKLGTGVVGSSSIMGGAVLGGALGAPFGGPFGMAVGAGVGAAAGKGLDELVKYFQGTYDQTPAETIGHLGTEAAINTAMPAAGAGLRAISPLVKSKFFGVTPQSAGTANRLLERGAQPPIGSVAPEATGFERKRQLSNVISGDLSLEKNLHVIDTEVRGLLQQSGMPADQVERAVEEIQNNSISLNKSEAGHSIVDAAKRHIAARESRIDAALSTARSELNNQEAALRSMADRPVGRVAQDVSGAIVADRRRFSATMREAYRDINELAGDAPVVDITEAIGQARRLEAVMPPNTLPRMITDLANSEETSLSIERAHALRSSLREAAGMANLPNLTPDQSYAMFARVEDAVDNSFTALAERGSGLPREAALNLRQTDSLYREGIAKFKDRTLRQLVQDTRSGLVPNPEKVAQTVMRDGNIERTREIMSLVTPTTRQDILTADLRNTLDKASSLTENGRFSINGKALVNELRKRDRIMSEFHPPQLMSDLRRFATELSAADGDISIDSLSNPTRVAEALRNWSAETRNLDTFVKENPLAALRSGDPKSIDRALAHVTSPGNTQVTESAMALLTPEERTLVQAFNLKKLFSSAMETTEARGRSISGNAIEKELSKYTERQQEILFPYGMAGDLRELAHDIRFLFPDKTMSAGSSQAEVSVTSKSFFNPFALRKRVSWFLSAFATSRPAVLRWFADLHRRDPNQARLIMGSMGKWLVNAEMNGPSGGKAPTRNDGRRSEVPSSFQTAAMGTPKVKYTTSPPKQGEPANLNNPMDPSLKEFLDSLQNKG